MAATPSPSPPPPPTLSLDALVPHADALRAPERTPSRLVRLLMCVPYVRARHVRQCESDRCAMWQRFASLKAVNDAAQLTHQDMRAFYARHLARMRAERECSVDAAPYSSKRIAQMQLSACRVNAGIAACHARSAKLAHVHTALLTPRSSRASASASAHTEYAW